MGARTIDLDSASFDSTLAKHETVFIDFWAAWCGPCRQFAPTYDAAAGEYPDVAFAKVDTEAHEDLSERFEIQSIPTLIAFRGGAQVLRLSGALSPEALRAAIENVRKLDLAKARASAVAREQTAKGERPAGVPALAEWDPADSEWAAGPKDPDGKKHSVWRYWRPDGTLCNECPYLHGVPHGPFKRFHENGEISQQGRFERGQLHGTRIWLACDAYSTERMHENGISRTVRKIEMDYDVGKVVAIRHFDAAGRRVLPTTGEPYPDRPREVPEAAEFREQEGNWALVSLDAENNRNGLSRFWKSDGAFLSEVEYLKGELHGRFGEAAVDGEFRELPGPGGERVTVERGTYDRGQPVGKWSLESGSGEILATRDLGVHLTERGLTSASVLSNHARSATEWNILSEEAFGRRLPGEGLLAAARAAATELDPQPLRAALERCTLPRGGESAQELVQSLSDVETFVPYTSVLLRGGDAAAVLRALAVRLDQVSRPRAALDFINAALLLAPDRKAYLFTRGLVLMSLGLEKEAAADAEALKTVEPKSGAFLSEYVRLLFPTFDFWPARGAPETHYDGLPDRPAQQLPAIRETIQKYVKRLQLLRGRIAEHLKPGVQPAWRLPDLSGVLDTPGPRLEAKEVTVADESVAIDEMLEVATLELPDLLRLARGDWNALCWLCWSCGLEEIRLPSEIRAPKDFGKAAGMSAQRLWRCRDKRLTGGNGARSQGIAGFSWEGIEIDALPPQLTGIAEQQYAEMQAMFYWLTGERNVSPWQDNLRGS